MKIAPVARVFPLFPAALVSLLLLAGSGCSSLRTTSPVRGDLIWSTPGDAAFSDESVWELSGSSADGNVLVLEHGYALLERLPVQAAAEELFAVSLLVRPVSGTSFLRFSADPDGVFIKLLVTKQQKMHLFLCRGNPRGSFEELHNIGLPADRTVEISVVQKGDAVNVFADGRLEIPFRFENPVPQPDMVSVTTEGRAELLRAAFYNPAVFHTGMPVKRVAAREDLRPTMPSPSRPKSPLQEGLRPADGYSIAALIPPTGLSSPSDVIVTSGNEVLVALIRGDGVVRVDDEGSVHPWAPGGINYSLAEAPDGTVYVYSQPGGSWSSYDRSGKPLDSCQDQLIAAPYESPFTVLPDGTLFFAVNLPGRSRFIRQRPGSGPETAGTYSGLCMALAADTRGNLYAGDPGGVYRIDPENGDVLEILVTAADWGRNLCSFHGLTWGRDGSLYGTNGDDIWKREPDGTMVLLARALSGLEGIAADTNGRIFTVSRREGALFLRDARGTRALIPSNGLVTPQALCLDGDGLIYVSQDEAMKVGVFTPRGKPLGSFPANAAQGPLADLMFHDGYIYMSEAAPGNPSLLVRFTPGSFEREVVSDAFSAPAGLAVRDGKLYLADNGAKKIFRMEEDGSFSLYASTVGYPNFIDFDNNGNLYVCCGDRPGSENAFSDTVYRIARDGNASLLWQHEGITVIKADHDGALLVSTGLQGELYRIDRTGERLLLSGMREISGIALLSPGKLLLSDDFYNALYVLEKLNR